MVALDPETGGVLALASWPSYDPNPLVSHDFAAAQAAHEALDQDPAKPLLNRALSETFPPGSTFKVLVAAAALQNGAAPGTELVGGASYTAPNAGQPIRNSPGRELPGHHHPAQRPAGVVQHRLRAVRRRAVGRGQAQAGRAGLRVRDGPDLRPGRAQPDAGHREPHGPDPEPGRHDRPGRARPVLHRPERGPHDPAAGRDGRGDHRQQRYADAALPHRHVAGTGPQPARAAPTSRCSGSRSRRRCPASCAR